MGDFLFQGDPLSNAMGAADDKIGVANFKTFDGFREEGEIIPIAGSEEGKMSQKGGMDLSVLNQGGGGAGDVKERVEVGVRKEFEKGLQHLFTAAHPCEPVMNDSNFHKSPLLFGSLRTIKKGGPA